MNNQKTNVNLNNDNDNDNDIVTMARFSEDGRWYLAQILDIKYTNNKQTKVNSKGKLELIDINSDNNKNNNSNPDNNVQCVENKDYIDEEILVFVLFTEYGNCEWIDLLDVKLPEKWIQEYRLNENKKKRISKYQRKQKKLSQMTYEQLMALKFTNNEMSHFDYVCKLCFRLFGNIFTLYCDGAVIEQLISMNFINNNVISNHGRLRCCQRDYKSRCQRYYNKYKQKIEICTQLCKMQPNCSNFYAFDLNIIPKQANTTTNTKQKNNKKSKKSKNKISKDDEKIDVEFKVNINKNEKNTGQKPEINMNELKQNVQEQKEKEDAMGYKGRKQSGSKTGIDDIIKIFANGGIICDFDETTQNVIEQLFNNNIEKWCKYEIIFTILANKYLIDIRNEHGNCSYDLKYFRNKYEVQFGCKYDNSSDKADDDDAHDDDDDSRLLRCNIDYNKKCRFNINIIDSYHNFMSRYGRRDKKNRYKLNVLQFCVANGWNNIENGWAINLRYFVDNKEWMFEIGNRGLMSPWELVNIGSIDIVDNLKDLKKIKSMAQFTLDFVLNEIDQLFTPNLMKVKEYYVVQVGRKSLGNSYVDVVIMAQAYDNTVFVYSDSYKTASA